MIFAFLLVVASFLLATALAAPSHIESRISHREARPVQRIEANSVGNDTRNVDYSNNWSGVVLAGYPPVRCIYREISIYDDFHPHREPSLLSPVQSWSPAPVHRMDLFRRGLVSMATHAAVPSYRRVSTLLSKAVQHHLRVSCPAYLSPNSNRRLGN